jgi:hypothetical protein
MPCISLPFSSSNTDFEDFAELCEGRTEVCPMAKLLISQKPTEPASTFLLRIMQFFLDAEKFKDEKQAAYLLAVETVTEILEEKYGNMTDEEFEEETGVPMISDAEDDKEDQTFSIFEEDKEAFQMRKERFFATLFQ